MFSSFRVEYLSQLFGILLHVRFVSSSPFMYFFNHLHISACTHGYLLLYFGF